MIKEINYDKIGNKCARCGIIVDQAKSFSGDQQFILEVS